MSTRFTALLLGSLCLLTGCMSSVLVHAPSQLPARVPVHVFPSVWVAGDAGADQAYLLDTLAAQLAKEPRREVRRVEMAELEPARVRGLLSPLTAVVRLELSLRSGTRQYTDVAPVQYCGMFGCAMQYQSFVAVVAELTAEATLTVHEGPTARVLQRERFVVSVTGDDEPSMEAELWERLASELSEAVQISQVKEPYRVYLTSKPKEAERGVDLLAEGKLDEGRAALERAAKLLGGLDRETQAQVWYNLGIARMVAPGPDGLTAQAQAAAERALTWAVRLEPSASHRGALKRLKDLQKRAQLVEEQSHAREHNFGLLKVD